MIASMNRLLLLCLSILLLAAQALGQQQEFSPADLAATYFVGHTYGGSSLTLEADGKYSKESGDCTMEYFESGTYVLSEDGLHFTILKDTAKHRGEEREINLLDAEERKEIFRDYDKEEIQREFKLVPVKWSDRIYLISEDSLKDFANAINLKLEPRSELRSEPYYGSFYLRQGDEEKEVSGSPNLPEKWLSFLLDKPVTATIISIEEGEQERIATINKGSKDGLHVGMRLLSKDEEPSPWSGAEILSVEERTAKVRVDSETKKGNKLSTKYERRDIYR